MFYFKATITVENGNKKYGDLPLNYTVGYEDEEFGEVYFPSLQDLSADYNVIKLTKEEYETLLGDLQRRLNEKKQVEIEETRNKVLEKQREIEGLVQSVVLLGKNNEELATDNADLWYENIMINSKLTSTEKEIADLWYEIIVGGM